MAMLAGLFASCKGNDRRPAEGRINPLAAALPGDTVSALGNNICSMTEDRNGNFWFASNGEGAFVYDGKILRNIRMKHGLCSDNVLSIREDKNGTLWFSAGSGNCTWNGHLFSNVTEWMKNAAEGSPVFSESGLVFNLQNSQCYYNGLAFCRFNIHPATYHPPANDLNRPYQIYSYLVDSSGTAWFGTQSEGVARFEGKKISYITGKNLNGPAVRTIFRDRAGMMWFGNNGGGLFRFDGKNLRNITMENGLGNPAFLEGRLTGNVNSLARVWTINEDSNGKLWIGTIDAGLWTISGERLHHFNTAKGLPGNSVWASCKDRSGNLWFVFEGKYVVKWNGQNFESFSFAGRK